MIWQDADTTKISRVANMRRWSQSGKCDRHTIAAKDQPPVTDIKFGHGSILKERQAMKIPQRVRNVVIESINLANAVH
jgi:hypothetical protein